MIRIQDFITGFDNHFPDKGMIQPWNITGDLVAILHDLQSSLREEYDCNNGIAIHKTATIESNVHLKAPVIIGANSYVCANAYLREGVFLGEAVKIGPGCEIKSSIIFHHTAIAHFNYIGNSIIGSHVNFEAGSITANHFNERADKRIWVKYRDVMIDTDTEKFGSLVGDHSKIGANAVLSPGTILLPNTVVKRLELVNQLGDE